MTELPVNKKIILFDGVCNLCNSAVLTVIKHDHKNNFVFAPLQSATGKKIIKDLHIDVSKTDSIILFEPNVSYNIKSSAALKVMGDFGGFWILSKIGWIFPVFFRDFIYDYIAKNRYKWFGKQNNCMIPTPKLNSKFLD